VLFACVAAVLWATGCIKVAAPDTGRKEIEQTLQTYLRSVKTADVALASTVWMQRPDIVVVTPLGRYEGWGRRERCPRGSDAR
jgi:hypothetical protein